MPLKMSLSLLGLLAISLFLGADYGMVGVGFIICLYLLHSNQTYQAVVGSCFLSSTWRAGLAFIPIFFYNGKRGFIRGKWKYAFYAFYPVHLLILFAIEVLYLA